MDLPDYAVGVVNHRSYDELERCLASLCRQEYPPILIVVVDAESDPERAEAVRSLHPSVLWDPRPNFGYSGGANRVLAMVRDRAPGAEFVLILNPDIELEPDFSLALLRELRGRGDVALASGKLLRGKSGRIDSAGIILPRNRRPLDRGSGDRDRGLYDRTEYVFGVSGAALMIRTAAANELSILGQVFDEDFFVYHEDTDLAWRAGRLGWKVLYVPAARAVHGRRWKRRSRFEIPPSVRRHSFKNHYLQIIKNERARDLLLNLPILLAWEVMRLGFALLRDRSVLGAYADAARLAPDAWRKRKVIHEKARRPGGRRAIEELSRE